MRNDEMITIAVGYGSASTCIVLPRDHEIVRQIEELLPRGLARSDQLYDRSSLQHRHRDDSPSHSPSRLVRGLSALLSGSDYSPRSRDTGSPGYAVATDQSDRVRPTERRKYRRCCIAGCDKIAVSRGVCRAHGGGRRCQHDGCPKSAQSGGDYCWSHGGGHRCRVVGCSRKPTSRQLCRIHGDERQQSTSPAHSSAWDAEPRAVDGPVTLPSLRDVVRHPVVYRL